MDARNILTILLTIATILFLSLSLYFLNENMKVENSKRQLSGEIARLSVKEFSLDLNNAVTGQKAPDVLLAARNDVRKHLSELMNGSSILFYRYTRNNCLPCYEEHIRLIQEIFSDFHQRMIILASYHNRRDFLVSVRNRNLEIPIYHIPLNAFDWRMERYNAPYFFVLHPCLRISNIFVPNEHYPELTIQYLESIKRLLQ